MPANYDYKYTDKEYEILMLKKELRNKVKPGTRGGDLDDSVHEMNELIESEEEINCADVDEVKLFGDIDDDDYDADERSLNDSDDERIQFRKAKAKQAKINNSFTGPYPIDPTDFNHTDKGPNNQFEHLLVGLDK